MNIVDAVKKVSERFEYLKDDHPKFLGDTWQVMKMNEEGKYRGDCDDFAITCFWNYSDRRLFKFLFHLLITRRYKMYRCLTTSHEWHVIGCVDDLWFDNWSLEALTEKDFFEKTNHRITMKYNGFVIGYFLLLGLFFDKNS